MLSTTECMHFKTADSASWLFQPVGPHQCSAKSVASWAREWGLFIKMATDWQVSEVGTLAGPRPGRADANQCKSSDFLQELHISGFPRFWVSPTCFPREIKMNRRHLCPAWMPYTCGTSVKAPCHARVLKSPWWWACTIVDSNGIHRAECSTCVPAHKQPKTFHDLCSAQVCMARLIGADGKNVR